MRNNKNRMFVIALLLFALVFTGAYALLATNLNIAGTATGTGDFKIEFSSLNVTDESKATATLDSTKTSINIDADLSFPGDTVTINFIIKNTGSLAAKVSNLIINENSTDDFTIKIEGLSNITGTTLGVGDTTIGSVVITWNTSSTNPTPENVSFDVTIDYVQAT